MMKMRGTGMGIGRRLCWWKDDGEREDEKSGGNGVREMGAVGERRQERSVALIWLRLFQMSTYSIYGGIWE